MKQFILILFLAASVAAASAQTPANRTTAAKAAVAHSPATPAKLSSGPPPVHGIVKTAFSLRYEDIKIGTGLVAQPVKRYKILYTGWLAADGHKFDSTDDHPRPPALDKDDKPVMGADGKPKLSDPVPIAFNQGTGRVIPGFDQGFNGMRIGGKRRLFIPWQLGYGARGYPGPDQAHPAIPPNADLIFDVELVDMSDIPMPPNHPPMTGVPGVPQMRPGKIPPPASTPASPPNPAAPPKPAEQAQPATPSTPPPPAVPEKPATPPAPQSN